MDDIDEDEDVEWGTLPPTVSHVVPESQGEELGPTTPSVLRQTGGRVGMVRRFGHMHTMIDSDEQPLVRATVIGISGIGKFRSRIFQTAYTARRSLCLQRCTNSVRRRR